MKVFRFEKAAALALVTVIAIFAIEAGAAPAVKQTAVKKPVAVKTVAAKPKAKPAAFAEWMPETGDATPAALKEQYWIKKCVISVGE